MNRSMKHALFASCLACAFLSTSAMGQMMTRETAYRDYTIGFGPSLSNSPGVAIYGQLTRTDFLQSQIALGKRNTYDVSIDYDIGYPDAFDTDGAVVSYWGMGLAAVRDEEDRYPRVEPDDDTEIGMRIPVGININIAHTPLMASAEAAPTVLIAPVTYSYVRGALGLKVMF